MIQTYLQYLNKEVNNANKLTEKQLSISYPPIKTATSSKTVLDIKNPLITIGYPYSYSDKRRRAAISIPSIILPSRSLNKPSKFITAPVKYNNIYRFEHPSPFTLRNQRLYTKTTTENSY